MILRGRQTLLNLFDDAPEKASQAVASGRRGRSADEIAKRNDYIFHRYYYYVTFHKYDYEKALCELNDDVWLSTVTIAELLVANVSSIGAIRKAAPNKEALRKKWPKIQW